MLDICHSNVPRIFIGGLPVEEREQASILTTNLHRLGQVLASFGYALALFDRCESECVSARAKLDSTPVGKDIAGTLRRRDAITTYTYEAEYPGAWKKIAGAEAARSIWDFFQTLVNIKETYARCPTIKPMVAGREVHAALTKMAQAFPDRKKVRDAPLHPADLDKTPGDIRENSFSGSFDAHGVVAQGVTNAFINVLEGRSFVYTIQNEVVEFQLSQATFDVLYQRQQELYAAFREVKRGTLALRQGASPAMP